jgi:hypothetical protein
VKPFRLGGIFWVLSPLLLLVVVVGHPLLIEDTQVVEKSITLFLRVDATIPSVCFDIRHGDRDRTGHRDAASVIKFTERIPDPIQVREEFGFV